MNNENLTDPIKSSMPLETGHELQGTRFITRQNNLLAEAMEKLGKALERIKELESCLVTASNLLADSCSQVKELKSQQGRWVETSKELPDHYSEKWRNTYLVELIYFKKVRRQWEVYSGEGYWQVSSLETVVRYWKQPPIPEPPPVETEDDFDKWYSRQRPRSDYPFRESVKPIFRQCWEDARAERKENKV